MKKKLLIIIPIVAAVIAIAVVATVLIKRENLKKKFAKLGEQYTFYKEQDYDKTEQIQLPKEIYDILKETNGYKADVEDSYLMYNNCNRRCEIRNFKLTDFEKFEDKHTIEKSLESRVLDKIDVGVDDAYIVNATMEVRYRCDYEDGTLPEERLHNREPYMYNGFWSEWKTEDHSYGMYKVNGEWYVCDNDDEE